jgi:DHA1 family bicyclomycin/chloramphenicol resistance-like MFS transporter
MKQTHIGTLLVATVALMIGGIDIYLPTFPHLVEYFETTPEFIQFTLMISPLTSALVSFIWGRQADIFSHKHLMLFALILFGAGSFVCALSNCDLAFLLGRFIQAIGGSGLSILSIVLLYDIFEDQKKQASYMALYGAMFPAVFALAPMIGAQLFHYFGWRSCFYFVTVVSTIFFALYAFLLKEYDIKQRKKTTHHSAFSEIKEVFANKIFVSLVLGHSLPIAISMLFTANSSFVFQDYFCFSPVTYSIVQSAPIALNFIGSFYYRYMLKKISINRTIEIAGYSLIFFNIALFLLIFTPIPITPITLIIVMGIFTFFMSFSISSCATKAIEACPDNKGIAIAAISSARNFIGSGVVIIAGQFLNGTPYPMLYAMLVIALILVYILLYYRPWVHKDLMNGHP